MYKRQILNGNIPVNYYENTLEIDAHDIVNPQEVFENKYKEYRLCVMSRKMLLFNP